VGAASVAAVASSLVCLAAWRAREVAMVSALLAVTVAAAYLALPRWVPVYKAVQRGASP
jgi:hypothetical protein